MDSEDKYRALEPLLHGLAHEIRNPIQGILASSEALAFRFAEDDQGSKLLNMIQRECVRINSILSDLLDLAHPVEVEKNTSMRFESFLKEAIRNFQQQKGIRVHADIQEDLPAMQADVHSLHRGFAALLENAAESHPQDGSIQVSAERAGAEVKICVQDNGEGIQEENRGKIFEPFFSTRPKKAGLGLTIADRIVRLHGGRMNIESTRGEGTSVTIYLPVKT